MTRTIDAIYENGVLRPLQTLNGLAERERVRVTVTSRDSASDGITHLRGTLPDEDAAELLAIIEREFEKVNPSDW